MADPLIPIGIPVPHYYAGSAEVKYFVAWLLYVMNTRSDPGWVKAQEKAAKGPANGHQLHESTREQWEAVYPVEGSSIHTYIHRNKDAYVCFQLSFLLTVMADDW